MAFHAQFGALRVAGRGYAIAVAESAHQKCTRKLRRRGTRAVPRGLPVEAPGVNQTPPTPQCRRIGNRKETTKPNSDRLRHEQQLALSATAPPQICVSHSWAALPPFQRQPVPVSGVPPSKELAQWASP